MSPTGQVNETEPELKRGMMKMDKGAPIVSTDKRPAEDYNIQKPNAQRQGSVQTRRPAKAAHLYTMACVIKRVSPVLSCLCGQERGGNLFSLDCFMQSSLPTVRRIGIGDIHRNDSKGKER